MTRMLCLSLAFATAACGDDSAPPSAPLCAPGASQSCTGPGGCPGGQICAPDGLRFGPCDCGDFDAGDPAGDAGSDAAASDASGDDAGGPDAGPPPTLPMGCDPLPAGRTRATYVLTTLEIPTPTGDDVTGFDLDATDSGAGSMDPTATCEQTPADYTWSAHGLVGVDNNYQTLESTLDGLLAAGTIDDELLAAIVSGTLLYLLEVDDIDDRFDDPAVTVRLYQGTLAGGGGPPMLNRDGRIALGQTFDGTLIDERPGQLVRGVVSASFATLDLDLTAMTLPLASRLTGAELMFYACDGATAEGGIGGAASIDRQVAAFEAHTPGIGTTIRSILESVGDLTPSAADPAICESLSVAYAFEGVGAARNP